MFVAWRRLASTSRISVNRLQFQGIHMESAVKLLKAICIQVDFYYLSRMVCFFFFFFGKNYSHKIFVSIRIRGQQL